MSKLINQIETTKLHFLLGKWKGSGFGKFPTIESFEYDEELFFEHDGLNDLIHYQQRTWMKGNKEPLHWESGFINPVENKNNYFEISNSQDGGRVEVLKGKYKLNHDVHTLHFKSKLVENDPRMVKSERIFKIEGDKLEYLMKMTTKNITQHQQHLKAELKKIKLL